MSGGLHIPTPAICPAPQIEPVCAIGQGIYGRSRSSSPCRNVNSKHGQIECRLAQFIGPTRQRLPMLSAEVIGETRHDAELRHFNQLIQEAEDARENLVRLRSRREALERKAGEIGGLRDGQGSVQNG